MAERAHPDERLRAVAHALERHGASLTLHAPGLEPIALGPRPATATVVFHSRDALRPLLRGDPLRLAEAYLRGGIDVEGDLTQVMRVAEILELGPGRLERAAFALRLALSPRRRLQRKSISRHYDRPADFFLAWLDRWRSYSHGFYRHAEEDVGDAQARKLQYAIDTLGLKPGMRVFDMGGGWGCFVEYAGLRGIEVHAITISTEQHRFLSALIRDRGLPCSVELVDFLDYRPRSAFDGAVFMGTFEHMTDYDRVARFLARWLAPGAKLYADFCSQRETRVFGAFMRRYIWPGTATYVDVPRLVTALGREGFGVHELVDDTLSYAFTVRAWADALEAQRAALAARHGEETVRAFLLFLRGSEYHLLRNKTQGYHLVAGREAAALDAVRLS